MSSIVETACAKINLSLEVLGRRADGYHELRSFVAFAVDIHDVVTLTPGARRQSVVSGPFGGAVDGVNLVDKAVQLAMEQTPGLQVGRFDIRKEIPVAAGLGGGSADAAAALRALARLNAIASAERAFAEVALAVGADVPVCLGGGGRSAAVMGGVGEVVVRPGSGRLLAEAGVYALLVNPGVAVPTGEVFRRLAAAPLTTAPEPPQSPGGFDDLDALIDYLGATGNDLEAPALEVAPEIGNVLEAVRRQDDCRMAGMSGSGATCFGLFATRDAAEAARGGVCASHPAWWAAVSVLG